MDARRPRPRRHHDRLEWRRNQAPVDDYPFDNDLPHLNNGFEDLEDPFVDYPPPGDHPGFARPENAFARPRGPVLGPSRRQNIVVVSLPNEFGGARPVSQGRYSVDRDLLFEYLPRTRNAVRQSILHLDLLLSPDMLEDHPEHMIRCAARFIFGHLERLSRVGDMDMFGAAVQQIEDDYDRRGTVREWAATMHAVCIVLNNDTGLGCSDDLLGHIMGFLEILFREVHDLIGAWQTAVLFQVFGGIFRGTRREYAEQLRRIYSRFDPDIQDELLRDMRLALPNEGFEGTAQRMYRALRP
ncbi:hypothetical protein AK830_g8938 [Neonectria ditissima]|uniref:Uncharacterized protein n=1 Tax=Neonectria ditissima TaxID=78410 RepID=A0A0P7AW41_9HYPO|nr:hypothetical protein AK830_g8938 [Neonectria ditissima]